MVQNWAKPIAFGELIVTITRAWGANILWEPFCRASCRVAENVLQGPNSKGNYSADNGF